VGSTFDRLRAGDAVLGDGAPAGETLGDRLVKGRLPLPEALTIATEIADASQPRIGKGSSTETEAGKRDADEGRREALDFASRSSRARRPAGSGVDRNATQPASLTGEG